MTMLNIISLGAGVQSSTMALMAAHGEITPMPDCAIFADTGDESAAVYKWLAWLEFILPFPVVRVSVGKLSIAATTVRHSKKSTGRYLKPAIPVFFAGAGIGGRHCTLDFKIVPIQRYQKMIRGESRVRQWIGISSDEAHRMKPSRETWCDNHYPLIDADMTRLHCLEWMEKQGYEKPPRSACVYCPYHSDEEWARLKDFEPAEFDKAVVFEKKYQAAALQSSFDGVPYLHDSCIPLEQVTFDTSRNKELFGNECEGMCGV